jgi:hypothetical protein
MNTYVVFSPLHSAAACARLHVGGVHWVFSAGHASAVSFKCDSSSTHALFVPDSTCLAAADTCLSTRFNLQTYSCVQTPAGVVLIAAAIVLQPLLTHA